MDVALAVSAIRWTDVMEDPKFSIASIGTGSHDAYRKRDSTYYRGMNNYLYYFAGSLL